MADIRKMLRNRKFHKSCTADTKLLPVAQFVFGIIFLSFAAASESRELSIRMPDIRPDHAEQYLCKAQRVTSPGEYIVALKPIADSSRVHHMLLYGCQVPGIMQRDSPNFVWDCSSMFSSGNRQRSYEEGPICKGKQQILYGWALNAPALKLPDKVGFFIGGDSNINFLVLQVHYGHYHMFKHSPDLTDNAGLTLAIKPNDYNNGITRRAGVLLMVSNGYVETGKSKHEIMCQIKEDIDIHPFRFRVHTHKLGTKVWAAKIGREENDLNFKVENDIEIGTGDPQKPQMFYPVRENITLESGDTVYAACEFNNPKNHIVKIGQTGDDEMCNFYLMYWTNSEKLLETDECIGRNPQSALYRLFNEQ